MSATPAGLGPAINKAIVARYEALADAAGAQHCGGADCCDAMEHAIAVCLCACQPCRRAHALLEQAEDAERAMEHR
jgi:hypothetical protein